MDAAREQTIVSQVRDGHFGSQLSTVRTSGEAAYLMTKDDEHPSIPSPLRL